MAIVAGVLAGGTSLAAFAADGDSFLQGTYLRLGAGLSFPESSGTQEATPFGSVPASVDFDTGYNITGAFGYEWASGLRLEGELGYRHADLAHIDGVATTTGSSHVGSAMVNALYDFHIGTALTPYVGGGIGAGHEEWNNVYGNPGVIPGAHMGSTDFQWQLIGGLSFPLSNRVSLFTEYRYITLDDPSFRNFGDGNLIGSYGDHSHNVLAGLRFNLGG
jgi:opacity protein-like surface antigen